MSENRIAASNPNRRTGCSVTSVASAGLKQGDVIQEVNRRPVRNVAEFEAAVRNSKDGTLLLVNRDGHTIYVGV